jgi:hypothetical protein
VMTVTLADVIFLAGLGQASILIASSMVPSQLKWREELRGLSPLHRQMHWVYGGYVVLSIVAFAAISLLNATEIAHGGGLARAFCAYVAVFWGIRLVMQKVFTMGPYLTRPWMRAGYATLGVMFALLTAIYFWAAVHPASATSSAGLL